MSVVNNLPDHRVGLDDGLFSRVNKCGHITRKRRVDIQLPELDLGVSNVGLGVGDSSFGCLHLGGHRQTLIEQRLFFGQVILGILQPQLSRLLPDTVDVLLTLDACDVGTFIDAGALNWLLAAYVLDVEKVSTNLNENVGTARSTQTAGR